MAFVHDIGALSRNGRQRGRRANRARLTPIEPFATNDLEAPTSAVRTRRLPRPDLSWMRRVLWPAIDHFISDEGFVLAGYIAFTALFAMFPFMIFLLAFAGFMGWGGAAADAIEIALDILPREVEGVLRPVVTELRGGPHGTLLTISIALSVWFSSSGLESLRHALNLAFGVKDPPAFWANRLKSMALTVIYAAVILAAMVALVGLPVARDIFAWLAERDLFDRNLYTAVRYVIGVGLLLIFTIGLYLSLTNTVLAFRDVLPGALISVSLWVVATAAYSIYLRSFGRYSILYGSLGGVIFTLFFFYISAIIFIFGAQINAAIMKERRH
ncbi:MAG: YihY/virulence factor BrkB family protein [Geminicoccaceae bacterium]|nr:YihY/virulence factor BrkB family protein [Geminicoccaceae bacterium]